MEDKEVYNSLLERLSKDFSLERDSVPVASDLANVKNHLTDRIKLLMAGDYQRFLNSLYRIDVSENKVHEILHSKDKLTIAERLADLIIERQLLRIKSQLYYKQYKNKPPEKSE